MLAFWCISQNFGDALTYAIVERITGKPPQWVESADDRPHMIGIGSILNHASKTSVVWGAGIANMADGVNPQADVRLVRGPLSALRVFLCGGKTITNYGDPALLCPRFFEAAPKQHQLGFIPHYVDHSHWNPPPGSHFINVLDAPEKVIREISSCRHILSSSLHGLIVADAFGIPAAWLHSPRVAGDGTKFADHFLAVSGCVPTPLAWEPIGDKPPLHIINLIPPRAVSFDADAILKAFPHELQ